MSTADLRDAKTGPSDRVNPATNGGMVANTAHNKPAAALASIDIVEAANRAPGDAHTNFGEYLMSFPESMELEYHRSKMRDIDL